MSRTDVREVRLEIVRPGKPHNQLLSPLTPYMALCGEGSPITFYVEFEHQQLLTRLERLRYLTRSGQTVTRVPPLMREAELGELGTDVGRIFSKIETLSPELARAQCASGPPGADDSIVHLRLAASGSELALVPFELAISPLAYPGEGLEFFLQASLPVVITREIRRGRPVEIDWDRSSDTEPRVLFVFAEPGGMKVPAQQHLDELRSSLEPWIRHVANADRVADPGRNDEERLRFVKQRLRVLQNASIEDIYEACANDRFTHVHILAHGDTYEHAGNTRYGLALCKKGSPQEKEVVSGKRLAKALQAEDRLACGRSGPLVVTLATCDSGNQANVLVPGGSIAHDLHVEGVPWVFASQFPLTVPGSVRMARALYPRLLRGDDPRQVLFEVRRQLYLTSQSDHDWASIVAYAVVPRDFREQISRFRAGQIKGAINVALERADSMTVATKAPPKDPATSTLALPGASPAPQAPGSIEATAPDNDILATIQQTIDVVENWLRAWRCSEPTGDGTPERLCRAEIRGMHGSAYKRIALLLSRLGPDRAPKAEEYYRKSLEMYQAAMIDAGATGTNFYWTATQSLSLQAVKDLGKDPKTYQLARALAERDVRTGADDSVKAWAHATLAELDLLRLYHDKEQQPDDIREHCRKIAELMGPESFHVGSTLRQFLRYRDHWTNPLWAELVQSGIDALQPRDDTGAFAFPKRK